MNGGHILQSSLVLQQMINTGNPNWWSSMRPPPPSSSSFFSPLPNYVHDQSNELSWSQLLMGGLVNGEEEKQIDSYPNASLLMMGDHVKQENSATILQQQYIVHDYSNEDHHFHQASSPKSCVTTNNNNSMMDFSSKKSNGRHPPPDRSSQGNSPARGVKKARVESSSGQPTINKVRKEKLGDRVTALHQIVSPFGKTDTASVLLETIGYIRFLQSQIEALSLPYLGHGSANNLSPQQYDSQEEPKDLRSRGLCLVPISCTLQVGSDNGADFWAPSLGRRLLINKLLPRRQGDDTEAHEKRFY